MIRKIAKIGPSTLMISLPAAWAKKNNLSKGDEINIEESENSIQITPSSETKAKTPMRISIDISALNTRAIKWVLSSLHKKGYEEIELIYGSKDNLPVIHQVVSDLFLGFVISKQTDKLCILKSVSVENPEEFDTVLRRAFLVTLSMAESTYEFMKEDKISELKSIVITERTNNQLTNFCERLINKNYVSNKNISFNYTIVWNLEKVCDNYKYIIDHIEATEMKKFSKNLLSIFKSSNEHLREYYEAYYSFDVNRFNKIADMGKKIIAEIKSNMSEAPPNERIILAYLMMLTYQIMDFSASTVAINL